MQKWEYRFVAMKIIEEHTWHLLINGKEHGESLKPWEIDAGRWQLAEQLGDEGWELISVGSLADMIFKRPKQ